MKLLLTLVAVVSTAASAHAAKLPLVSEGAARAAIQDVIGNACPGVMPDYAMKAVLIIALKEKSAAAWAAGYEKAARELLEMLSDATGRATVCDNALSLYGPSGSAVPRLLLKVEKGK